MKRPHNFSALPIWRDFLYELELDGMHWKHKRLKKYRNLQNRFTISPDQNHYFRDLVLVCFLDM
jgi:hypothetical protein